MLREFFACTLAIGGIGQLVGSANADSNVEKAAAYATDQMHVSGVPGFSIAIVQGERVLYVAGSGVANADLAQVTGDTGFIIGSTTKSFTALCVMQLVEAGAISLDAPVALYLPKFMNGSVAARRMTVRMLLNHTSGISHSAGDQPILDGGERGSDAIRHWEARLSVNALDRPVGHSYEYSNANYIVLGALIETVSGETYASYLQKHVLVPLGMSETFTSLDDGRLHGMASGHRQWFGQFQPSEVPYPAAFVPVGFLITTANDMSKYLAVVAGRGQLHGTRILTEASLAEMHRGTANFDETGKTAYAMGWVADTFNGVPVVYHDGDTGRFTSVMAISRGNRYGVAVLANGSGWLHGTHMIDAANGAINLLEGKTPKSYAMPYMLTTTMLAVLTGVPMLQFAFLIWSFFAGSGAEHRSLGLGLLLPAVFNIALAGVFVIGIPQFFLGIPLVEHVYSVPDMGSAALLSAAVAVVWVASLLGRLFSQGLVSERLG